MNRSVHAVLVVTAAVALASVALQSPASATTTGRDGLVAYVSPRAALFTVDLHDSGASPVRLAAGHAASGPRFNPTGKRIAYADPASGAILTVPTAGGPSTTVYAPGRGGSVGSQPTWSPPSVAGGQQLAFVRTPRSGDAAGRGDLWLVKTNDGAAVGVPTRLTRDGAVQCGDSSPDWSPDGTRIAYRRSLPTAAGSCTPKAGARLATQVLVRTLSTGKTVILPAYPASAGSTPTGPVRFASDGRSVVVGKSFDASGCTASQLAYTFATSSYTTVAQGSSCDSDTQVDETVPTPAGGLAEVTDDFTPNSAGGYSTWCLRTLDPVGSQTASRCHDIAGSPWQDLDVQPLRTASSSSSSS